MLIFDLLPFSDKNLGFLLIVFILFIIIVIIRIGYDNVTSIQKNKETKINLENTNINLKNNGILNSNVPYGKINNDANTFITEDIQGVENKNFIDFLFKFISIIIFLFFLSNFLSGKFNMHTIITLFLCILFYLLIKYKLYIKILIYFKINFPNDIFIKIKSFFEKEIVIIFCSSIGIFIVFGIKVPMYTVLSILAIYGSYNIQSIMKKYGEGKNN